MLTIQILILLSVCVVSVASSTTTPEITTSDDVSSATTSTGGDSSTTINSSDESTTGTQSSTEASGTTTSSPPTGTDDQTSTSPGESPQTSTLAVIETTSTTENSTTDTESQNTTDTETTTKTPTSSDASSFTEDSSRTVISSSTSSNTEDSSTSSTVISSSTSSNTEESSSTVISSSTSSTIEDSSTTVTPSSTSSTTEAASTTQSSTTEKSSTTETSPTSVANSDMSTGSTTTTPSISTSESTGTSTEGISPSTGSSTFTAGSSATTEIVTLTTDVATAAPTTPINISGSFSVSNTEDALIAVSMTITFQECLSEQDAKSNISNTLKSVESVISVSIWKYNNKCGENGGTRRKLLQNSKTLIEFKLSVRALEFLQDTDNITRNIKSTIYNWSSDAVVEVFSNATICDSDVCQDALLKYKGFQCEALNATLCEFTTPCFWKTCGDFGHCKIEADGHNYKNVCKCNEDDIYQYTLSKNEEKCERGGFSFKTWMIIAAGAGGLIILILLFVVVVLCAKRKGEATPKADRYVYDVGDNDRETLMYSKSYDQIQDQYHRKPSFKDMALDSRTQTSLQTFDNHGYDHWDPVESRETYASMDRHFQSPDFQPQITRPKLATNRYSTDQLTPF